MDGDGDNSRSKESGKLVHLSQARYLVNVKEALGYSHSQTLDSSLALVEAMMQEYAYLCNERNKNLKKDTEEGDDYEWIELPSWDDPTKTVRMKKYDDIGGKIRPDANIG